MKPEIPRLHREIARAYIRDANDFLFRFKLLKEEYSKSKRMKAFVDLLMGFECALKAHIFLSASHVSPEETYRKVKSKGHDIAELSTMACYASDRAMYDESAYLLADYNVFLRYSLDGYESFFPSGLAQEGSYLDFSSKLTNSAWLDGLTGLLEILIDFTASALGGVVDIDNLFDSEIEMREFAIRVGVVRGKKMLH